MSSSWVSSADHSRYLCRTCVGNKAIVAGSSSKVCLYKSSATAYDPTTCTRSQLRSTASLRWSEGSGAASILPASPPVAPAVDRRPVPPRPTYELTTELEAETDRTGRGPGPVHGGKDELVEEASAELTKYGPAAVANEQPPLQLRTPSASSKPIAATSNSYSRNLFSNLRVCPLGTPRSFRSFASIKHRVSISSKPLRRRSPAYWSRFTEAKKSITSRAPSFSEEVGSS
mmetsp:Transcript_7616/g.17065  ORF Transcript_7616/g.17065 Transcript_7616/m.17065 type:complete len:230 (+) Transcript_7616:461-1150(+)